MQISSMSISTRLPTPLRHKASAAHDPTPPRPITATVDAAILSTTSKWGDWVSVPVLSFSAVVGDVYNLYSRAKSCLWVLDMVKKMIKSLIKVFLCECFSYLPTPEKRRLRLEMISLSFSSIISPSPSPLVFHNTPLDRDMYRWIEHDGGNENFWLWRMLLNAVKYPSASEIAARAQIENRNIDGNVGKMPLILRCKHFHHNQWSHEGRKGRKKTMWCWTRSKYFFK